jgi:hypothetical protein
MTQRLWSQEGQDVAEHAVILAVVILLVVVTVRLIGSSSTDIFSAVGSSRIYSPLLEVQSSNNSRARWVLRRPERVECLYGGSGLRLSAC